MTKPEKLPFRSILMLGWEYPPVISGGLGIATKGLAEALSQHFVIKLIVPGLPDNQLDNLHLSGVDLNELPIKPMEKAAEKEKNPDKSAIKLAEESQERLKKYRIIQEYPLTPYPIPYSEYEVLDPAYYGETWVPTEETKVQIATRKLYDADLETKVANYTAHVVGLVKNWDFDLIHAHDWMTFPAALAVKELTNKPLVLHVHSLEYDRGGSNFRNWIFEAEKNAFQHADAVIAVSAYSVGILAGMYNVPEEKLYVAYNGLDMQGVKAYKKEKKFPEKLVLFLGRVTGQKGPAHFLQIAEKVAEAYENVRFVVAGTGDLLRRAIEAAAGTPIAHRIHYTGYVTRKQVYDLLAMADVYVMPSVSEPFGLSALEAAYFGVPVVMSDSAGASEVLGAAETSPYHETENLAGKIVALLENKKLAAAHIQRNKDALNLLTWEHTALQVIEVYSDLAPPAPENVEP